MQKGESRFTVRMPARAVNALFLMGYIDGRKRATKRNLSKFISGLILNFAYGGITGSEKENIIKRGLALELSELTSSRNDLEEKINSIALRIAEINRKIIEDNEKLKCHRKI